MADVAIDPQNSNPKELYGQGVRAYVLQDYENAVRAFSRASELLSAEHGSETHDSLGDVYLYYGKALLELSRKESGPLGEGVLKNVEEDDVDEDEEEEIPNGEEKTQEEGGEAKDKVENEGNDKIEGELKGKSEEKPKDKIEGKSEDKIEGESEDNMEEVIDKEADAREEAAVEDIQEEKKEDDELTDLQVAWEVLELAKRIFTTREAEGKKNLAETLIILGEISLESGNFASAIDDISEGLKIQKTLFGNDSRTIAETYYKLGGAYSTNAQIDEAIQSFISSLEYLKNKVSSLEKDKEANAEEIEELNTLIPEVEEKIADMKNLKTEIANKVTAKVDEEKVNGTSEASSSKQVNDISHLVKRKRKEDDSEEENPAKKPSP